GRWCGSGRRRSAAEIRSTCASFRRLPWCPNGTRSGGAGGGCSRMLRPRSVQRPAAAGSTNPRAPPRIPWRFSGTRGSDSSSPKPRTPENAMIASSCPPQVTTTTPTSAVSAPRGRPSWSGLLRLSLVALPVKAYPAVASTPVSHFHLLHAGCGQRLQYQKRCPKHGPIPSDEIVKGYPYARDHCVVVEPEELEKLRPAKDKALTLEQFVALREIDPVRFAGRSLYLVPDGIAAQHPYDVLVTALHKTGTAALGRVVWP